ncbi:cell adhesion molecule [Elysia marginata]|uniref:Cell adhesion molecule n=1 Tax=Elysia marginata TaxID=1093978 RepID=A0AAV4GRL6_9GAST|nr:cell adhesion molecule [Elysia marginata]
MADGLTGLRFSIRPGGQEQLDKNGRKSLVPPPCFLGVCRGRCLRQWRVRICQKYKWLKDGDPLVFTDEVNKQGGQGTLTLFKPQEKDTGYYQCIVSNKCGTAMSRVTKFWERKLDPFQPVDRPSVQKAVVGSNLKLSCNAPYRFGCNPKPVITWLLSDSPDKEKKIVDIPPEQGKKDINSVPLDDRVAMDSSGNLYITNVKKEDEKGGAIYVCDAYNEETRSGAKGEDKIIKVIETPSGTEALIRPPDKMWSSPDQVIGLEGSWIYLMCIFSGNPTPVVTWKRIGGVIDPARHDNMKLTIKATPSNEGTYECTGKNKHGSSSQRINVKVEAAPLWLDQPLDTVVGPEEDAEFKCRARGIPEPTVEWFINGKPIGEITPDPKKWELDGHTLRFKDLEMSDSKVIQCNVSNVHGSVFADVYLFVEAMAPVIERGPLEQVVVAEERELRITCQMKGKPKPKVVWYKGGQPLQLERYQYQDNGDLIIKVGVLYYRLFVE